MSLPATSGTRSSRLVLDLKVVRDYLERGDVAVHQGTSQDIYPLAFGVVVSAESAGVTGTVKEASEFLQKGTGHVAVNSKCRTASWLEVLPAYRAMVVYPGDLSYTF